MITKHLPHKIATALALCSAFASQIATAQCPAVGVNTTCAVILTITDTGATVTLTGQGPFDGIEDSLIGVINKSSLPIGAIGLTSVLSIFGFDGDGLNAYGIPGNPKDPTGYGGPNAYFTGINSAQNTGTVNFIVPLAPGTGTAFFALEESITSSQNVKIITVNGSPVADIVVKLGECNDLPLVLKTSALLY